MTTTKEEFEAGYAARSSLTVEALHALGMEAQPCKCEYDKCQGWAMTKEEKAEVLLKLCPTCRRVSEFRPVGGSKYRCTQCGEEIDVEQRKD